MKNALAVLQFFKEIGIDLVLIVAGIFGGFVFVNKTDKLSTKQKIGTVISGGLTANYVTPLVADWMNLSENSLYGIAFFLGYGGLKLVEKLFLHFQDSITQKS